LAANGVHRGDVDHPAPARLDHRVDHVARHVEDAVEVGRHHRAPLVRRHPAEGGLARDAGAVHQDVHLAVLALDAAHHLGHGVEVGHVAEGERGARAVQARGRHRLLPLGLRAGDGIVRHDEMSVLREPLADRGADATDTAGDEGYSSCHVVTPFRGPKKNPRTGLGFKPLSGKAIKEEETLNVFSGHLARGVPAALTPASAKLLRFLAALVSVSNAAVVAASCDLIAATATSLPPGAAFAAWSTPAATTCWKELMRSSARRENSACASEATSYRLRE